MNIQYFTCLIDEYSLSENNLSCRSITRVSFECEENAIDVRLDDSITSFHTELNALKIRHNNSYSLFTLDLLFLVESFSIPISTSLVHIFHLFWI